MEDAFRKVVEHIFKNWTALNLAAEHSGAGINSREVVIEFVNYIVQYCLCTANIDAERIQEALDDIMDQEFETICEDNSTKEIATVLHHFVELTKEGNIVKFEEEYQKLPLSCTNPLQSEKQKNEPVGNVPEENVDKCTDMPMEQDSEWTEVKSRKKR